MNLYLIDDETAAKQCRQLLSLRAECVSLLWSRTSKKLPGEVENALNCVLEFIESSMAEYCTDSTLFGELNDDEREYLFTLFNKSAILKATLGSGVVLAGKQASDVQQEIAGIAELKTLNYALTQGLNLIIL